MTDHECPEMEMEPEDYDSDIVYIEGGENAGVYLRWDDAELVADAIKECREKSIGPSSLLLARLEKLLRSPVEKYEEALVLQFVE